MLKVDGLASADLQKLVCSLCFVFVLLFYKLNFLSFISFFLYIYLIISITPSDLSLPLSRSLSQDRETIHCYFWIK